MNRIALVATMLASTAAFAGTKASATVTVKPTSASSTTRNYRSKPTSASLSTRSGATRLQPFTVPVTFNNPFAAMAEQNMKIMAAAFEMNPFVQMYKNAAASAMMFSPLGYGARFSPLGY